ncbi:hypothetical protein L7F22_017996 [Adiantum nelumboides]|nr:hypothetical protein [Adiantum nelumboides]
MPMGEPGQLHSPTWSAYKQDVREPCQRHHHHYHHHHYHHHYHHQWTAFCCRSPSSLSPSPQSSANDYTLPASNPHIRGKRSTHIASLPCTACIAHVPPSDSENTHNLAAPFRQSSHISPSINDLDLYHAAPTLPSKRPKRPCTLHVPSKVFPPLPSPSSPPYVVCQHCFQLLDLPILPPEGIFHSSVFKIKCALCMRLSIFNTHQQRTALPSTDAAQMRTMSANGELRCKTGLKNISENEPTIFSLKDHVVGLELNEGEVNASVFMLSEREAQQKSEEEIKQEHLNSIELSKATHSSRPMYRKAIDQVLTDGIALVENNVKVTDRDTPICETPEHAPICDVPPSAPKLNPEFAGFSSVQDWMNSLAQDEFFDCPTPLNMGGGFGSGLLVRIDDPHGNDIAVLPVPGSPLHEHLGYKSARDLLDKSTLSSDDEIMAYSVTNSSSSNSSASVNTFKPPGFDNGGPSLCTSLQKAEKSHAQNYICLEQENSASLTSLFKRTLKCFDEKKSLSVCNSKSKVVVNGHALSESAVKTAEERAGKLLPGAYWYDRIAGFWGITGGPCLGVLPPFIEELDSPMARNCSNGDTQVFVNGRELHHKDLALLSHRGLSKKPGEAYVIGFNGVVIVEASGQELIHLGKLAPTVEKRGKGFGMFMEQLH